MPRFESVGQPSSEIFKVQDDSIKEIESLLPSARIEAVGAMAVPMMGREELDILVISEDITSSAEKLEEIGFKIGPFVNEIQFMKKMVGSIEVALQVMLPENRMIGTHKKILELLRSDDELRHRYELFKQTLSGLTREEYKKKKNDWLKENILNSL